MSDLNEPLLPPPAAPSTSSVSSSSSPPPSDAPTPPPHHTIHLPTPDTDSPTCPLLTPSAKPPHPHDPPTALICIESPPTSPTAPPTSTFWPCALNLSKVILGASMMALPKAFAILGVLLGSALLLAVGFLTAFTIHGLMKASDKLHAHSYSAVVRATCGPAAQALLQAGIALTCFGNMVIYLVVIVDVLVGTAPTWSGVLPEVLHLSPTRHLLLTREAVLAMLCLFVLAPLCSLRSMTRLNPVNIIGNLAVFGFAACTTGLAVIAVMKGQAYPVQWWPDWSYFHSGTLAIFIQVAAIVPVVLNADICQHCIHPLVPLLRPYSLPRLDAVISTALALCNSLYLLISLTMAATFGPGLDADALNNISAAALAPLVGPPLAHLLACGVRFAFLISLIGSFALIMWPLRTVILDYLPPHLTTPAPSPLADPSHPHPHPHPHPPTHPGVGPAFLPTSWALLASIYLTAVYVPNVWLAISLVGATATTLLAFIMPGLVILLQGSHRWRPLQYAIRASGAGIAALGCFLMVDGVLSTLRAPQP